jgi:hypothetical protein
VQCVATQPIQLPDHDRVALADIVEERGEARAVVLGTRDGVGERLHHVRRFEACVLLSKGLRDRGGTGMADAGTGAGAASFPYRAPDS